MIFLLVFFITNIWIVFDLGKTIGRNRRKTVQNSAKMLQIDFREVFQANVNFTVFKRKNRLHFCYVPYLKIPTTIAFSICRLVALFHVYIFLFKLNIYSIKIQSIKTSLLQVFVSKFFLNNCYFCKCYKWSMKSGRYTKLVDSSCRTPALPVLSSSSHTTGR